MSDPIICPCCGNDKFVLCESFGGREKLQCANLQCLCAFYPEAIDPARVSWEHFRGAMEACGYVARFEYICRGFVLRFCTINRKTLRLNSDELRALGWAGFARRLADE